MAAIQLPLELINDKYLFLFDEPHRSCPFQIIYGGASSGKSVTIAQRDIIDCMNEPRNFLIVRKTGNTLRNSVFEERCKVIREWGLSKKFRIRESDMDITYLPRGNKFYFRGLDDVEKIKSITTPKGPITDLRVEEATEIKEEDLGELRRRMRGYTPLVKRVVLSFNPTFRTHWIAKKFFHGQNIGFHYTPGKILILRSTYRDNKFLTRQDREHLEGLTGYQRSVYCDGYWGVLGNLILTNWEIADIRENHYDVTRYGIDFGFSDDPAAVVKVGVNTAKKELYIQRDMYIRGGTNDVLAAKAKPLVGDNTVWCDSAEPKSIRELREQGENSIQAYGAKKGKDSVWHSLQWLQQMHIFIDKRCFHTIDEISQLQWQKDKDGNTLNIPVDKNDHCIAGIRYATERDRKGRSISLA